MPSTNDLAFRDVFDKGGIEAGEFDHRGHLRLAYVHLCTAPPETAIVSFRTSLRKFIARAGAPPEKYHETVTRAWLEAVSAAMQRVALCQSADEFLTRAPELLDKAKLDRHYTSSRLSSDAARRRYLPPDLAPFHASHDVGRA